jgi:hypothetical protein
LRAHHVNGLRLHDVQTGWTGPRPDWAGDPEHLEHCHQVTRS